MNESVSNFSHAQAIQVEELGGDHNDCVFIAFASPEKRCLGIAQRFGAYSPKRICLLRIGDEPNDDRAANIKEFRKLVSKAASVTVVPVQHSDVIFGIEKLLGIVKIL